MTVFFRKSLAMGVLALLSTSLIAQEIVPISDEDIVRMGVVFAAATPVDTSAGARYPATVVNSPDSAASLVAPWAGTVVSWALIAGQSAGAGDVLATLRSQDILPLQNEWIAAVSALEGADFELRKDEALFSQGVISQQRLVQTTRVQQQAAFAERTARSRLAQGGFNAARLQALREQGTGLGEYFLVAHEDGVLTQRMHTAGAYVESGELLATLNAGARRWVSAHVPARAAASLALGHAMSIAVSGETLTLRQKDFVIDSSNQTIELLAEFDTDTTFTTGQILSLVLPPAGQGVLIPDRAVVHSGSDTTVFVRTGSGVEARSIALQSIGADYLAVSGIAPGEQIAIQGTAILKGIQLGLGGGE